MSTGTQARASSAPSNGNDEVAPCWYPEPECRDTKELLRRMRQFRKAELKDRAPQPFWDEELLYTPHGKPPES
eukprot:6826432-Prorocentrum_lima.AAC.1